MYRPTLWALKDLEVLVIVYDNKPGGRVEAGYFTESELALIDFGSVEDGWLEYLTIYSDEMRLKMGWHFLGEL